MQSLEKKLNRSDSLIGKVANILTNLEARNVYLQCNQYSNQIDIFYQKEDVKIIFIWRKQHKSNLDLNKFETTREEQTK